MSRSRSWLPFALVAKLEFEVLLAELDDRGAETTLRLAEKGASLTRKQPSASPRTALIGNYEFVLTSRQYATFEIILAHRVSLRQSVVSSTME